MHESAQRTPSDYDPRLQLGASFAGDGEPLLPDWGADVADCCEPDVIYFAMELNASK